MLDSSVVVRYLTNDPPDMADVAARIIDSEERLIVSELVIAESGYVLQSVYGVPRPMLIDALMGLVRRQNIAPLHLPKDLVLTALNMCRNSKRASFVDALQWAEARHAGIQQIYTFDRRFPGEGLRVADGSEHPPATR